MLRLIQAATLLFSLLMAGCASVGSVRSSAVNVPPSADVAVLGEADVDVAQEDEEDTVGFASGDDSGGETSDSFVVRQKMYRQYLHWKGTRYRAGGMDKSGLDCSGLVYLAFRDEFGMKLPRTAAAMAQLGMPVARTDLLAGDLVFFKNGLRSRHVGIYLGDDEFLHASTSQGVMISRLHDYYWRDHYWQARRVR